MIEALFFFCLRAGLAGSAAILAAFLLRLVFRGMPAKFRCLLWMIVALRLLTPFFVTAPFGVLPAELFEMAEHGASNARMAGQAVSAEPYADRQENIGTARRAADAAEETAGVFPASGADAPLPAVSVADGRQRTIIGRLSLIWLAGVAGMLFYMLFSTLRIERAVRFAVPENCVLPSDGEMPGSASIRIYRTDAIDTPFLFGVPRPKIYLPHGVRGESLVHIIRHECAHAAHGDHLCKPLFFFTLSLHWFNPLVWAAFLLFGRDMEEACDDRVVAAYASAERRAYADALLSVAAKRRGVMALTVAFGEIPVRDRVMRVLAYRRAGRAVRVFSTAVCLLLCVGCFSMRSTAASISGDDAPTVKTNAGDVPAVQDSMPSENAASGYLPFSSANYRLEPDDEQSGYHLYTPDGSPLGGLIEYADVVAAEDTATGERYLFTKYIDFNAYQVLPLTGELEADLQEVMGGQALYLRPLAEYTISTDAATGLQYIVKNGHRRWEGHVLLWDKADERIYDALAADYDDRFMPVFLEAGVGYIYADMEVKNLCFRYDGGFVMLGTGQFQSVNLKNSDEGFLLALTNEEYDRLADWLETHRVAPDDRPRWDFWTPVFDELDIDYNRPFDVDSPRYQAAVAWLKQSLANSGGFLPEGMSEEQLERNIRNEMKHFDEDGDPVAFGSLPGMTITSGDGTRRQELIDVPEKDREALFSLIKTEFMQWRGLSVPDADARSEIYHAYQVEAPKAERLKGTWSLQQYERIYTQALVEMIREENPDWEQGDPFDTNLIASVTREQIEARLVSDGRQFSLLPREGFDE